jgi:hypothetical protein
MTRRWRTIGVVLSLIWLIALPIYVMFDSNRRADEFYSWCRSVESRVAPDSQASGTNEFAEISRQQEENCRKSAMFMTPAILVETLIAGTGDTLALWSLMLGPVVICWLIAGIIVAAWRQLRREV